MASKVRSEPFLSTALPAQVPASIAEGQQHQAVSTWPQITLKLPVGGASANRQNKHLTSHDLADTQPHFWSFFVNFKNISRYVYK